MDWCARMNAALAYIEANLDGEIDYGQAAGLALLPPYQFQKVFSIVSDIPLSEYVRLRRLSQAAAELCGGSGKVIDIAMKYGYDSPTAFTRAFKNMHGISPSMARRNNVKLKAYPPISFQLSIKGAVAMNYKISEVKPFRIVGVKMETTTEDGRNWNEIPAFWQSVCAGDTFGRLCKIADAGNGNPPGVLGVCYVKKDNIVVYYIAVAYDGPVPEGMEEYTVEGASYAQFECVGPMPSAIQDVTKRIYTDWFPSSGYAMGGSPDIEVYPLGDTSSDGYRSEVWVSVKKSG